MAETGGSYDLDNTSSATSAATGGRVSTGMIIQSSGNGLGIVKMLAIAGIAVVLYRVLKGGK